jgi:hypothetical protein
MYAQLQDGVDIMTAFLFQLLKGIDIPGIEHHRFFADGIGADPQGKAGMGIMQIVGRTDTDVVNPLLPSGPTELFDMAVKPLKFRKKADIFEEAIKNADRIIGVNGGDETVSGFFDCFKMPRGNITGDSGYGEIFHHRFLI